MTYTELLQKYNALSLVNKKLCKKNTELRDKLGMANQSKQKHL